MQHQVAEHPEVPTLTKSERRKHPRTISHTTCEVRTRDGSCEFQVRNLSAAGALLSDGPLLPEGKKVLVVLRVPLYPEIEVWARIRRRGRDEDGAPLLGIEFLHDDVTEDHIQSALLSELERSHTHGIIPV